MSPQDRSHHRPRRCARAGDPVAFLLFLRRVGSPLSLFRLLFRGVGVPLRALRLFLGLLGRPFPLVLRGHRRARRPHSLHRFGVQVASRSRLDRGRLVGGCGCLRKGDRRRRPQLCCYQQRPMIPHGCLLELNVCLRCPASGDIAFSAQPVMPVLTSLDSSPDRAERSNKLLILQRRAGTRYR